jgi:hypothetical protein
MKKPPGNYVEEYGRPTALYTDKASHFGRRRSGRRRASGARM